MSEKEAPKEALQYDKVVYWVGRGSRLTIIAKQIGPNLVA